MGSLSRGVMSLCCLAAARLNPYPPHYRAAFAFSGLLYPLSPPHRLRFGYRHAGWLGGARGAYPVAQRGPADRLADRLVSEVSAYGPAGHVDVVVHLQNGRTDPRTVWLRRLSPFRRSSFTSL